MCQLYRTIQVNTSVVGSAQTNYWKPLLWFPNAHLWQGVRKKNEIRNEENIVGNGIGLGALGRPGTKSGSL